MTVPALYKRPALPKRAYLFTAAYAKRYSGSSLAALVNSKFRHAQRAAAADSKVLTQAEINEALQLPDNSELTQRPHAVGLMLTEILADMRRCLNLPVQVQRSGVLISPEDNYLNLGFDPAAVARDRKHAHYINDQLMLRTHMSSAVPALLRSFQPSAAQVTDTVYALPGRVFRRDAADKIHLSHPHQLDLWRFGQSGHIGVRELELMVAQLLHTILPGANWRMVPASHPYLKRSRQIDVWFDNQWLEIGECGLINGRLLAQNGLAPSTLSGLAIGIGLDRAVMLRKNVTDIRYVDSADPALLPHMQTLNLMDPDLLHRASFTGRVRLRALPEQDLETLGDAARHLLGAAAKYLESMVEVASGRDFLELDVTLSSLAAELTPAEANALLTVLRERLEEQALATA